MVLRRGRSLSAGPRARREPAGPLIALATPSAGEDTAEPASGRPLLKAVRVYPFGVSSSKLEQAARALQLPLVLVRDMADAEAVVTLRSYFRRFPDTLRDAESRGVPVHVLRSNAQQQMQQALVAIFHLAVDPESLALRETEDAIARVLERHEPVELPPAEAYIRRQQHAMAERYNLASKSWGREPNRRVRIFREPRG
jgi:hypothetical protein